MPICNKQKPALGIIPEAIWKKQRFNAIKTCITRRIENYDPVMPIWIEEYNRLLKDIYK